MKERDIQHDERKHPHRSPRQVPLRHHRRPHEGRRSAESPGTVRLGQHHAAPSAAGLQNLENDLRVLPLGQQRCESARSHRVGHVLSSHMGNRRRQIRATGSTVRQRRRANRKGGRLNYYILPRGRCGHPLHSSRRRPGHGNRRVTLRGVGRMKRQPALKRQVVAEPVTVAFHAA